MYTSDCSHDAFSYFSLALSPFHFWIPLYVFVVHVCEFVYLFLGGEFVCRHSA